MTEAQIQQKIVIWFNNNYCINTLQNKCVIFAVPNGGSRNPIEAKHLKLTGVKAGVSDLIVLMPNRCMFIEVKTENGTQQESQKQFQKDVEALGFEYKIVRSLEQFKQIVCK